MDSKLTERHQKLLKAIIEEFIESGEPVGSQNLVEKYSLKVSPATVRNEMVRLTQMGYLTQPHTSAGRQPTNIGLRFYIDALMGESELPVLQEVSLKQQIWQDRFEIDRMLYRSVSALAEVVGSMVLIATEDSRIFSSGAVKVLDYQEFFDIDVTRAALHLCDQPELLLSFLGKVTEEGKTHILLGEEIGLSNLSNCGVVFAPFTAKDGLKGILVVLGPSRMKFSQVLSAVYYTANLLSEIGASW